MNKLQLRSLIREEIKKSHINEDLRGLMAQGEKIAAFADKQSGYEGGLATPVRGVLAAMTVAGAPDFDGDEDLKAYYTRKLTKAIETQKGKKYMSGFSESVNEGSSNINGIQFDDSFFEADHEWMVQNKIELAQIINNAIASSNIKKHANKNTKTITISLT